MSCIVFARALRLAAVLCLVVISALAQQSPTDQHGKSFDPLAEGAGKPIVLIFLRTDCPISNRYAPTIQALAEKYAGRATFWLVYPDRQDSPKIIADRLQEYGYRTPWLRDPDHVLAAKANVTITPEAAVFDQHGKLQYHGRIDDLYESIGRARPAPTKHDLDDVVQNLLSSKAIGSHATQAVGCYIADSL